MILHQISRQLGELIGLLRLVIHTEEIMSQAMDNLVASVKRENDVVAGVTALIAGLASQIKNASDDPRVQQLADQINSNSDTLAGAVAANTTASAPATGDQSQGSGSAGPA